MKNLYFLVFYFIFFHINVKAQNRNCAVWGYPKFKSGFSASYGSSNLRAYKNTSKLYYSGKSVQVDYTTTFWDATSVFNIDTDLGLSYNHINLNEVVGKTYNTLSVQFAPSLGYKPCFLNQRISLSIFPTTFEYLFSEFNRNKQDLNKFYMAYGFKISYTKSIYRSYEHSRYLSIDHWQVFASALKDYHGIFLNEDVTTNFTGEINRMLNVRFGFRVIFDGYEH